MQTAPLLSRKVSYDTLVPRAHKRDRQLPRAATAWEKRRLSAPGASRASQHLPQKVYQAVAAVSVRNFVRALMARRAEPEPEKARMSIDTKTGGRPHPNDGSATRPRRDPSPSATRSAAFAAARRCCS